VCRSYILADRAQEHALGQGLVDGVLGLTPQPMPSTSSRSTIAAIPAPGASSPDAQLLHSQLGRPSPEEEFTSGTSSSSHSMAIQVTVKSKHKRKWTPAETTALREGITLHGIGSWTAIAGDQRFGPRMSERRPSDLKDRWATMQRQDKRRRY
jgi:hypothetical protein